MPKLKLGYFGGRRLLEMDWADDGKPGYEYGHELDDEHDDHGTIDELGEFWKKGSLYTKDGFPFAR